METTWIHIGDNMETKMEANHGDKHGDNNGDKRRQNAHFYDVKWRQNIDTMETKMETKMRRNGDQNGNKMET